MLKTTINKWLNRYENVDIPEYDDDWSEYESKNNKGRQKVVNKPKKVGADNRGQDDNKLSV